MLHSLFVQVEGVGGVGNRKLGPIINFAEAADGLSVRVPLGFFFNVPWCYDYRFAGSVLERRTSGPSVVESVNAADEIGAGRSRIRI